jgi:Dolichyl-phosphate-mannose-protein mannosyltransferase
MAFLLVLPAWFAALLVFRRDFADLREAALSASVIWGVIVVVLTEGLSIFQAVGFLPLIVAWGIVSCGSFVISTRAWPTSANLKERTAYAFGRKHLVPATLVAGVCSIFLATLVVALLSPPNNWDSMTYHMARVANWTDHRSIHHYPTHILRQLYLGPWAEFAITHLQILTGGDRLANLIQFVSMLGSAVAASLVTKKLGAESNGQLFAFVYSATIPIGILEASTTQNDYVTAFWLLCFLNFAIDLVDAASPVSWRQPLLAGASLGLAVLTKITAVIFAAPFLLWVSLVLLRSRKTAAISFLAVLGATALTMNAGHIIRNEGAFGSPLGPPLETALNKNEIHTPAAVSSNLIRNLAVHLALPRVGPRINAIVFKLHSLTGLDINDQRITFKGEAFRYSVNLNENFAGNPIHLLVAMFAIAVALWRFPQNHNLAIYSICLAVGFLLFCGCFKWQPWVSRLHLPLFVAVAPVCGMVLSRAAVRQLAYVSSVMAIAVGLIYATKNDTRPLLGKSNILVQARTDMYFASRPALRDPFVAAAVETARGNPATIGIITGVDDWEYPLRLLVRMRLGTDVQFEHVNVRNESRNCPPEILTAHGLPDKVVVIGFFVPELLPSSYKASFVSDSIRVFAKEVPASPTVLEKTTTSNFGGLSRSNFRRD